MSYQAISDALHVRLATVSGIKIVMENEPTAVQDSPLIYSILDGFDRDTVGTTAKTIWRTTHTLCIAYHNPEEAERLLRAFVDSITAAVAADPRLDNTCRGADIIGGEAGFVKIADVVYRSMDFTSEALEISAY